MATAHGGPGRDHSGEHGGDHGGEQCEPSGGLASSVDVRPASQRFLLTGPGRRTLHSFSFGPSFDPSNVGFGPLMVFADDRLDPGAGYPEHRHADVEIVTWVLSGSLAHTHRAAGDPERRELGAGTAQALSAGSGVVHSELAAGVPTRVVQSWLRPRRLGGPPAWAAHRPDPAPGRWEPVASGLRPAPLRIRADATLHVGRLLPGQGSGTGTHRLVLPAAERVHLFVASGRVRVTGHVLGPGDAVRLTKAGALAVEALEPAEVLVWELG